MANTVNDIEDLLIEKIAALGIGGVALFAQVVSMTAGEFSLTEPEALPVAAVSFSGDENTDILSRLVLKETYEVLIVTPKKGIDPVRTPQVLCDAVRNAIHGNDFKESDISPFQYQGRTRQGGEGQLLVYSLKFATTHLLQITT